MATTKTTIKPKPVPTPQQKKIVPKLQIRTLPQLKSAIQSSETGTKSYQGTRTQKSIDRFMNKKSGFKAPAEASIHDLKAEMRVKRQFNKRGIPSSYKIKYKST